MEINIGDMVRRRAYLTPNLDCYVGDDYRFTFREINSKINQLCHYMKSLPIYPGDRIALLCKNRYQFAVAMFAAAKLGAAAVPLNWRLTAPELEYILNNSGTVLLAYDEAFAGTVDQLRSTTQLQHFIRIGGSGQDIEFEQTLADQPDYEPGMFSGGDDTAIIMYTSGTTGKPKGVMLTHNNFYHSSSAQVHNIKWTYSDRFLHVAPVFHIGGLSPLISTALVGSTCVFMADFDPVKAWQIVVKEKINIGMTVPVMLAAMLKVPDINKMDLSALEHFTCGGSIVPEYLFTEYKKLGITIENVYGATECTGALAYWSAPMDWDKHHSVGKPVFSADMKIVDPETHQEVPAGQRGEILFSGPQVFNGYWNNPEATEKAKKDGWYYTGDVGYQDEDGYFFLVDRVKDMIISGSENIYPAEIENVIITIPGVADVGVVGKPDEKWGEIPVAFVVKTPGTDLNEENIMKTCSENLAKFKLPRQIIFVDILPRNGAGKLLKHEIKKEFLG
ncbi:MAG: long-chain fatty acid--CoA ligase [Syntrophomonadaceae bacterium]|nr:long-chain fatty acid--CoA ligase [Syntrophomonadaceae bacterium]